MFTSEVLPHRQSAVHVKAAVALVLHAQRRGQHGLLALPPSLHLVVQSLGEAKHEEGRQEE